MSFEEKDDNEERLREIERELQPEFLERAAQILGGNTSSAPVSPSSGSTFQQKRPKYVPPPKQQSNVPTDKEKIASIMNNVNSAKDELVTLLHSCQNETLSKEEITERMLAVIDLLENIDSDIRSKMIYLILPDKIFRRQILTSLKTIGFLKIEEFDTGKQALQALIKTTSQQKVEFLITDINLVDVTIDALAKYIRSDEKINQACPFMSYSKIIVTTKGLPTGIDALKEEGYIDEFIAWPFNINALVEIMKKI